ncbi:MAG: hypothetical protein AAFY74_20820, partial [Pseudomonadota bacterium]
GRLSGQTESNCGELAQAGSTIPVKARHWCAFFVECVAVFDNLRQIPELLWQSYDIWTLSICRRRWGPTQM